MSPLFPPQQGGHWAQIVLREGQGTMKPMSDCTFTVRDSSGLLLYYCTNI